MASSLFHLLSASLLALAALSIIAATDQSQDSPRDADSAPSRLAASSLVHLLRRRSAELQAPPHYYAASRLAGYLGAAPVKRDDGYWIWMPAHGYVNVPRDEVSSASADKDSMGSLLRYGRK